MKIIVCVKQVPDTSGKVAVNPDGTLNRASMQTITNPDDMNAVEAALKLKDATGCKVVVVTMGPPPAAGMLRELMAMGADEGVLVSAREFGGSDTYATSQILAAAISTIGVEEDDIVMCGRQAIDGDTAQVGPQIAEKLHLPQVTYAADITKDGNTITVKRMLEDGYMTIKVKTPCLLTCIKELNEPRYMSIDGREMTSAEKKKYRMEQRKLASGKATKEEKETKKKKEEKVKEKLLPIHRCRLHYAVHASRQTWGTIHCQSGLPLSSPRRACKSNTLSS